MIGLYLGEIVKKHSVRDGRWCVAVEGRRDNLCLDSKITMIGRGRDTCVKEQLEDFSTRVGNFAIYRNKPPGCELRFEVVFLG